ncbi:MAG: hypothetical protein ACRD16_05035, partial [Thermoanaerobaculia bacterium]
PLYPATIAAVSRPTGLSPFAAGEAVSFAAFLGAVVFLGLLAREEGFDPGATVQAILAFPTAFFFLAVYTESFYLLLSAGCLLAVRRRRDHLAVLAGFLVGLCRPNGFLLSAPIVWIWLAERKARPSVPRRWLALASVAPGAGLLAFLAFSGWTLGNPFLPISVQKSGWHHSLTWPWTPLLRGWFWQPHLRFEVVVTLLCFFAAVSLWKRFPGYALYVALTLLMLCLSGHLFSANRYVLVLFPVFFLLGDLFRKVPWIETAYTICSGVVLGDLTIRFVLGFWVA